MTTPDVVACVVSHGQRDLLGPCLEALRVDDVPALVLENIPDGSASLALSLGARASVNIEPASFARNQNALFAATRSRYLLVLNPDCLVQPGDVPDDPVECDWMLGACLLVRRDMLDAIGGFDEGFPMYGEDIELQYRAMPAGWERWYVPDAVRVHEYQRVIDRALWSRRSWWHL